MCYVVRHWLRTCNSLEPEVQDTMLALTLDSQHAYPVEVSGWDSHENFFVEKTELHWSELAGKHVLLRSEVPTGTVVFLRLLDPLGLHRANPVPYRAERLDEQQDSGPGRLRLVPARPGKGPA